MAGGCGGVRKGETEKGQGGGREGRDIVINGPIKVSPGDKICRQPGLGKMAECVCVCVYQGCQVLVTITNNKSLF